MTTVLSNEIVETIYTKVAEAFRAVASKDIEREDAQELLDGAKGALTGAREKLLIEISEAAHEGKWEGELIDIAVERARSARNDQKGSSVATFASELRNAMRPGVRGNVRQMFATATAAWDTDGKDNKKPLRRAFVRRYHMVVGPMFEAAKGGVVPDANDVIDMALKRLRERELDHTRAWKGMKACYDQIREYYKDFPVDGLDTVMEYMHEALYTTDKEGKEVPNTAEFKRLARAKAAPEQEAAPAPEHDAPDPEAAPVSRDDALDNALNDIYSQAA